jgi:hypothetical protein
MIEYLVLNIDLLPFMFNVLKCRFIVLIEETFKFHIFNEAILILIDFFEEFQEVLSFQRNSKEIRHLRLHVLKSEETDTSVH